MGLFFCIVTGNRNRNNFGNLTGAKRTTKYQTKQQLWGCKPYDFGILHRRDTSEDTSEDILFFGEGAGIRHIGINTTHSGQGFVFFLFFLFHG